ncbi:TetR/AcrR family transcriptional regulator [Rhodococcus aerolatus]
MAGGTKRLPRAVREQQMLDAAVEVFSRSGFHAASMDDVAEVAAISKPMLYLYLGSKEELFSACLTRESERFVTAVATAVDPDGAAYAQLRAGVLAVLTYVSTHRDSWVVLYRQGSVLEPFARQVGQAREQIVAIVSALCQRLSKADLGAAHFDTVALAVVGAVETLANRMLDQAEPDPVGTAETVVELVWFGLAGPHRRVADGAGGPA